MDKLELKALGKLNLGLDILGQMENGYHEVRMVMQTVYLYDRVLLEKTEGDEIQIRSNLAYLPDNENNIAYKAAAILKEEFRIKGGIRITLEKHIPVAAGMAGGSADAAAALIGMNKIFDLQIPKHKLMEYGVKLGADVPYCIMKGTALSEGIGEKLTALAPMPDCYILLAKPPIAVSTKMVYENLHANELEKHPDRDGMVMALEEQSLQGITERMENVLETVTEVRYPVIAEIKACMKECGAMNSLMSGSGPTVFGIFTEKEKAEKAADAIRSRKLAKQVFVTQPYNV